MPRSAGQLSAKLTPRSIRHDSWSASAPTQSDRYTTRPAKKRSAKSTVTAAYE